MNTKVIITAEDQTGAGIASVKSSMVGLGAAIGAVSSVTTKLIDMLGEVARTTVALYKDQINLADSMDEMSTRMGMSIKDMTVWKAAAEMNGTSLEAMANGTRMLAKHMTEHGAALRKAGIDTKDTNQAFLQLSDLFKNMTDPVQRIDLATRLFGRGMGQQLLPVLIQGSEALKEIQAEAGKYGEALQTLSPEAQKLNDTLYLMGVNFKTAAAEGVFPLVKSFNDEMLPALREVAKEGSMLKTLWVGFGGAMKISFADPWNQTLLGAKATLQQFMADVETMLAKITFGKVSELHLREAARMSEAAKKTLAEAAGNAPKAPTAAPPLSLPGANTDAEAAALAASLRGKDNKGKGKAAPKTPLQKMIELGEKNLAAAKAAEYVAADDDEEARLGAHKREMESARLQKQEADAANKRAEAIKDGIEPLRVLARQIEEVNALRAAFMLTADEASAAEDRLTTQFAKQREAALDLNKSGTDAFKELGDAIQGWGNKAADTFAEFVVTGKASFSDLINSMLMDIARLQAKKMLDPITKGAGDWLSGLFSSRGGAGSMSGNGSVQGNSDYIYDLHSGGIAGSGEGSGRHLRSLAMFAGAPKYHGGGLAGDEVPAVLKRGEGVFTPGQMRALGGGGGSQSIRVEVVNPPGRPAEVESATPRFDAEGMVLTVVMREMEPGGRVARRMERQYGLNAAAGAVR